MQPSSFGDFDGWIYQPEHLSSQELGITLLGKQRFKSIDLH